MTARSSGWLVVVLGVTTLTLGGCGTADEEAASEAAERDAEKDPGEVADQQRKKALYERGLAGYRAGWNEEYTRAYRASIERTRVERPGQFRREVFGRALWVALLALFALRLLLVIVKRPSWWPWDRDGGVAGTLAGLIQLATGPRDERRAWLQEVYEARDTERHLKVICELAPVPGARRNARVLCAPGVTGAMTTHYICAMPGARRDARVLCAPGATSAMTTHYICANHLQFLYLQGWPHPCKLCLEGVNHARNDQPSSCHRPTASS